MSTKPNPPSSPTQPAVVDPLHDLIIGYPKLAGRMAIIPETAMFRRFGALNARSLLYQQSDLMIMEEKLLELEKRDSMSSEGKKSIYALDHYWLSSATPERDGDVRQKELMGQIRDMLKEYNLALIQQATILGLKDPDPYDIDHLQRFLSSAHMGPLELCGLDRYAWGSFLDPSSLSRELVVLKPRGGTDAFSRWLVSNAISIIKRFACCIRLKKSEPKSGLLGIKDHKVFNFTFWTTSIVASLAPIISIIVLARIDSLVGRLGTIAAFNVLISVLLTVLTDARKTEIFSVTTAFAAVQVVFVGQALDQGVRTVYCIPAPSP